MTEKEGFLDFKEIANWAFYGRIAAAGGGSATRYVFGLPVRNTNEIDSKFFTP
jgi:hypothetical protein